MVFALLSASDPGIKSNLIESDEARRLLGLGVRLVLSTLAGALSCGAGCPIIIWQISDNWWQSRACEIETLLASVVPKPGEGPQRKHYITNIIVMLAGEDRASARSDYLVSANLPPAIPVMSGTYLDMFVKREGAWRFARRELVHNIAGDMALKRQLNSG